MLRKVLFVIIAVMLAAPAAWALEIGDVVADINLSYKGRVGDYVVHISAEHGVSEKSVEALIYKENMKPGDVTMALRLARIARVSLERVMHEYRAHHRAGWGAIAKRLGIKPGSAEFHALKTGKTKGSKAKGGKSKGNKKK